ncbi:beta-1,3-glucanase family protein [Actinoplanes friuliensis]|uniref:Glucan endo-1,3-beta-D-glucosidase n=1 Tax=Actinoplanes friuliensis DSM 7358 TaxID=1246995 RepID=U5WAQ0_9ACTN|nr:beta-1,3-glucanase family protein [Actinoplanes friuliensis]AGZ45040.1 glucan endo-1,3-beta-D-glucosidase [Actinoplanes friuliensis DSM 7358]
MRLNRKTLLGLAVAAVAIPAAVAVIPTAQAAAGPDLLPLTVTNNSGRGEATHLYVLGVSGDKLGYVNEGGAFTPWTGGANPPAPAPDVSIDGPANGSSKTISVPKGISGRMYMSFGGKLDFKISQDGGLVQPAPWAAGDANSNILFDWSEFTYNDSGIWLNSSQVDMFAVPHSVSVTGSDGQTAKTGELKPGGRNTVIDAMKADASFSGLVQSREDGTVLRVLAPGKGADRGNFDPNYLGSYIDQAWAAYTGKDLTVKPFADQPDKIFKGRTSGDVMTFTDSTGAQVATFTKPSTANVWGCDGNLGAPNDLVVGPIARSLCAALQRTTLGTQDVEPSTDASTFYRNDPTNLYNKVIHEQMVDGKAYAFAFDDVANQESLVHSGDPTSIGITLTPFN